MPVSHIALHVLLCKAILQRPPQTPVAIRARLIDPIGRPQFDQVFKFTRGIDDRKILRFDMPFGLYRVDLQTAGSHACTGADYLYFLSEHNRDIDMDLSAQPRPLLTPILVDGKAPPDFAYTHPTLALFGTDTTCNHAVGTPLNVPVDVENEPDAYYATLRWDPAVARSGKLTLALQTTDASGGHHYIRIPSEFPSSAGGFPGNNGFNIGSDLVAWIASQPEDTLLCPRLLKTSVG